MKCTIVYSTSCKSVIVELHLDTKLWNFKGKKCGLILCAHKAYFLMAGHIL